MIYSNKEKEVRNYILQSFLKNYKRVEPYCFWPNKKFYNKFEPDLKAILNLDKTLVAVNSDKEGTNIYEGPFTLKREERVHGWVLGSYVPNKPLIYSLYVSKEKQGLGNATRLVEMLYIHLHKPKEIQLVYPTKQTFNCLRSILRGRARIFVNLD